jgi:hypothetical protein
LLKKKIPEETLPLNFTRFVDNFSDMIRAARLRPEESVSIAKKIVDIIMEREQREFPRSLSLLQFCFAEATLNAFIGRTGETYTPPITPELECCTRTSENMLTDLLWNNTDEPCRHRVNARRLEP